MQIYSFYNDVPARYPTEEGAWLDFPSGKVRFEIELKKLSFEDKQQSEILIVEKTYRDSKGDTYRSTNHIKGSSLFECIQRTPVYLDQGPLLDPSIDASKTRTAVESLYIYSDGRENMYFTLFKEHSGLPILAKVRFKYFNGELAVKYLCDKEGLLKRVIGEFRSNVILETNVPGYEISPEDKLTYEIPIPSILWRNSAAEAEEDGDTYWVDNPIPGVEVYGLVKDP